MHKYKFVFGAYLLLLFICMFFYAGFLLGYKSTLPVNSNQKISTQPNTPDINTQVVQKVFKLAAQNTDFPINLTKNEGKLFCIKNSDNAIDVAKSLTPYITNIDGVFTVSENNYYTTVAFYQNSIPNEGYPVEKFHLLNCNFLTEPMHATLSVQGAQKIGVLSKGASNLSFWEAINKIKELGIYESGYYGITSAEIMKEEFSENENYMEIKETVRSTPICDSDQCASLKKEYTTYTVTYKLDKNTNELFVNTPKVPYWN